MTTWYTNPGWGGMFGYVMNAEVVVRDPAKVLGIPRGSDQATIKKAFRRRAFETHPDRGGDPEEFLKVNKAYQLALAGRWEGDEEEAPRRPRRPKPRAPRGAPGRPRAPVRELTRLQNAAFEAYWKARGAFDEGEPTFMRDMQGAARDVRVFAETFIRYTQSGWLSEAAKQRFSKKMQRLQVDMTALIEEAQRAQAAPPRRPAPPPPPRAAPPPPPRAAPAADFDVAIERLTASERLYNEAVDLYYASQRSDVTAHQRNEMLLDTKKLADHAYTEFGLGWQIARSIGGVQLEGIKAAAKSLFDKIQQLRKTLGGLGLDPASESNDLFANALQKARKAAKLVKRGKARMALQVLAHASKLMADADKWAQQIDNVEVRSRRLAVNRQLAAEIQQLKLGADDALRRRAAKRRGRGR
jgi:hypothetical protein